MPTGENETDSSGRISQLYRRRTVEELRNNGVRADYRRLVEKIEKKERLEDDEINELFAYWQERLYLEDWDIVWRYSRAREMTTSNRAAEITTFSALKGCSIDFLEPVDFDSVDVLLNDFEKTLVHELLHLHIENYRACPENKAEYFAYEQGIELLAKSLVSFRRNLHGVTFGTRWNYGDILDSAVFNDVGAS
jgi:hypothetical protein